MMAKKKLHFKRKYITSMKMFDVQMKPALEYGIMVKKEMSMKIFIYMKDKHRVYY